MKGQDVLVRAFAELASRYPTWSVRLVGPCEDPAYEGELRTLAERAGIGGRVQWLGYLEQDAIDREYARASIFCLPSVHSESGGQVKYEAAAFGLPIVTTDVPCRADAIEMGCAVARAGDANELARELERLMADEGERRRTSHESQSRLGSYREIAALYLSRPGAVAVDV
jgi:glycosyltransferase involved in cell wall biosynthesis